MLMGGLSRAGISGQQLSHAPLSNRVKSFIQDVIDIAGFMGGDKGSAELKRTLSWELEYETETLQKLQKVELPSTLTQSNKKAKRLSKVDKIVNQYEDRHRKECHDFRFR